MRLKHGLLILGGGLSLPLLIAGYFAGVRTSKAPVEVRPATVHASLTRHSCIECHAPIAAEWVQSFHFRTVTGPFWQGIRTKGWAKVFDNLRISCMNCHAPANVLDLAEGANPVERIEAVELGIDCVSCHVSEQGIKGPGRFVEVKDTHEVIPDDRFSNSRAIATTICARCHESDGDCGRTVSEWKRSEFAEKGVACSDCHMPEVEAPLVVDGPPKLRRSHTFVADKDADMLRKALNASLSFPDGKTAVVRIVNDRVGHALPASGQNYLLLNVKIHNQAGQLLEDVERGFGLRELIPGYLDFWPFLEDSRIPDGESRHIRVELPSDHGVVSVEFRYRDFFSVKNRDLVFSTMAEAY